MKRKIFFIIFGAFFTLAAGITYNNQTKKDLDKIAIVTLKDSPNYSKEEVQNIFYNELINEIGFSFRKVDTFSKVINALSIKINENDLDKVQSLKTVKNAYFEIEYSLNEYSPDDPDYHFLIQNTFPANQSSLDMNKGESKDGENTVVAILDSALNVSHDAFRPLIPDENPRFSKEYIDNIKNLSDFNAKTGTYINSKIPFVFDYYDYDTNVYSNSTHGTHVSSIVSGNGKYKGIAPNSQLVFMKVFNDREGGATSSIYLKALEDAYLLDVDAINMSFGSTLLYQNETKEDLAVTSLINKMEEEGIEVFVASGNDGKNNNSSNSYNYSSLDTLETGASGLLGSMNDALSVASFNSQENLSNVIAFDGEYSFEVNDRMISHYGYETIDNKQVGNPTIFEEEHRFYDFIDEGAIEYVVIPDYGTNEDYASIDVKNKIALVKRGEIAFYEKIYYASINGAKGLLIYNQGNETDQDPFFSFKIDESSLNKGLPTFTKDGITYFDYNSIDIPVGIISHYVGKRLALKEDKKLTFTQEVVSAFSSQGTSPDLSLKPDIIAPGDSIYGALSYVNTPEYKGKHDEAYTFMSGTSMASPNAAGAYLSLLSNEDLSNRKEKALTTTKRMLSNTKILKDDNNNYISPRYQGAGLIDINGTLNDDGYLTYKNKSKIELRHNDDIKKGHLKFDINLNNLDFYDNYDVNVSILTNEITSIDGFKGEVVSQNSILLDSYKFNGVFKNGTISIDYQLDNDAIKYLERFTYGSFVEGYVEISNGTNSYSIPFLGYYGDDYEDVQPFESFDFEKDPSKTYESDLMNKAISDLTNKDLEDIYVGSRMLIGQDTSSGFTNHYTYYFTNVDDYTIPFTTATTNYDSMTYIKNGDKYDIYTGKIEKKRGITIQLFLKRSVTEARLYFDDKESPENTGRFLDNKFKSNTTTLYRSYLLMQDASLTGTSYTHKTVGYIPLVNDGDLNHLNVKDGLHTIRMEFDTYEGKTLSYSYNIYINQDYVRIPKIFDVTLKENILRINLKDEELISIKVNGIGQDLPIKNSNGEYQFVYDLKDITTDLFFEFENSDNGKNYLKTFVNQDIYFIYGQHLKEDYHFNVSEDIKFEEEVKYKAFTLIDGNNIKVSLDRPLTIGYKIEKTILPEFKIYSSYKFDEESNIEFHQVSDEYITFNAKDTFYIVEDHKVKKVNNILVTALISLFSILFIFLVIGLTIFIINFRKNKDKDEDN